MPGALDGIKILELTRVGPGAFCTMMLADMGAEVLKIEAPPSRKLAGSGASPKPEDARMLATSFTNRNKKSMTLNLKDPAGQAILRELAPATMTVTFEFAAVGSQPALKLVWHQGDSKPPGWVPEWGGRSSLFVGDKGMLLGDGKLR